MKTFPSIPRIENAPSALFEQGHLWIQEKVDGANIRFQLQDSGRIRFGDRSRVYQGDDIPAPYQHAVRHVRERLDRTALRNAIADVDTVVFVGEAMHKHTIDYDWDRTPSFLGFDIWSGTKEEFLPPDNVEKIYRRLGLHPINTFQKEVRAIDFDPSTYEIPDSGWYSGPAEGVILHNKTGIRAKLLHPQFQEVDETVPVDASADELARKYATDYRFEKLANKLQDTETPITFDTMYERVVEDIVREEHKQLFHGDHDVNMRIFRSEIAALTRQFIDERH